MIKQKYHLIQHLGIVAGICKETQLIGYINELIPKEKRSVTIGQAVCAMILNALGLNRRALYLTKRFFISRPVETLIGTGVTARKLNDASLSTALDAIYEYGITELFYNIASKILPKQGIRTRFAHLDSTS
jgi:transposase